ncbi:MAG: TonB-dependent receptor, partial [Gammaproteobacteria bacterium]|nr:TonB-dependent receptor [Gammaproteobacteria bacterium]
MNPCFKHRVPTISLYLDLVFAASLTMLFACGTVSAESLQENDKSSSESEWDENYEISHLEPIFISDGSAVPVEPSGILDSAVSELHYHPIIELQSRGLPDGQADIVVRGSVLENTGIKLGAVTLFDPQTGHYTAELPIDPMMLGTPDVLTGTQNAIYGFNANVATINYDWLPVSDRRALEFGVGTDGFLSQKVQFGQVFPLAGVSDLGVELSLFKASGDGTRNNGDFDFERASGRVQRFSPTSQTDLVLGYQDKFYGWPGAYTGFASLPETDQPISSLYLANHLEKHQHGHTEIGVYHRQVDDDYDFDRTTAESGVPGAFDHVTKTSAIGIGGKHQLSDVAINYQLQYTSDELTESTDLTSGPFVSRDYLAVRIAPEKSWQLDDSQSVDVLVGLGYDGSNRDSSA